MRRAYTRVQAQGHKSVRWLAMCVWGEKEGGIRVCMWVWVSGRVGVGMGKGVCE